MKFDKAKFLLLQIRNPGDAMRDQEIDCFAHAMNVGVSQVHSWDLLSGSPSNAVLRQHDAVLIGGSGDYSVTRESEWLSKSMDLMRDMENQPSHRAGVSKRWRKLTGARWKLIYHAPKWERIDFI